MTYKEEYGLTHQEMSKAHPGWIIERVEGALLWDARGESPSLSEIRQIWATFSPRLQLGTEWVFRLACRLCEGAGHLPYPFLCSLCSGYGYEDLILHREAEDADA